MAAIHPTPVVSGPDVRSRKRYGGIRHLAAKTGNSLTDSFSDVRFKAKCRAMWLRRITNLIFAAYLGGLVACYVSTYQAHLTSPYAPDSGYDIVFPLYFAFGILAFTIPGLICVTGVYQLARSRTTDAFSYAFAILCGSIIAGFAFWAPTSSLEQMWLGGFFGLVIAVIWSAINRYILPAF